MRPGATRTDTAASRLSRGSPGWTLIDERSSLRTPQVRFLAKREHAGSSEPRSGQEDQARARLSHDDGTQLRRALRVIDSLQLTAKHKVSTPVNWQPGEDVIIAGSVSDEEAKEVYPEGWESPRPYIRIVPQPR